MWTHEEVPEFEVRARAPPPRVPQIRVIHNRSLNSYQIPILSGDSPLKSGVIISMELYINECQ